MDSDWSQLFRELLLLILIRLPLPDCFNFGKVCRSWRSVFLEKRSLSRPPPFIVLIPCGIGTLVKQPLWSLHGGKLLKLCSPRPGFLHSESIIGSSVGWLVIGSTSHSSLQLLNPTSNERIPLPPISSDENQMPSCVIVRVVLSSSPTSGDCLIVATGYRQRHGFLAVCRPGDQEWTTYANQSLPPQRFVRSIAFYKGELIVLCKDGGIVVFAFDSDSRPRMAHTGPTVRICSTIKSIWMDKRLVESDGDLFLIVWHSHDMLEVFKQVGAWGGGWAKAASLVDRVFIIGNHTQVSFCVEDLMGSGFEANCVYYCFGRWMLVKFSLADRSSEWIPIGTRFEWISAKEW